MKNTMERSSLLIEYVYYIHYNEIFKKILKNKSLQAIERKVKRIIEMTREKFFESFIDREEQLGDGENKSRDVRRNKSNAEMMEEMMKKASAAYNVAYEAANTSVKRGEQCAILLSFPWIVYEILLDIKMRPNNISHGDVKIMKQSNIPQKISEFIDGYSEDPSNSERYANFMRRFSKDDSIVSQWMNKNAGLSKASFLLIEWANRVGGIGRGFSEENLIYLFVLFGLGLMRTRGRRIIQSPRNKGEHLLLFLDYISSEEFRNRSSLSFKEVGGGVLMRGEWRKISEPALSCFLSLVTTLRLPIDKESAVTAALRECEPRVMLLPADVADDEDELDEVRDALKRVSGCEDIRLRCIGNGRVVQVSAIGTSEQLRVLTSFIYPPSPSREESTLKGKVESLPAFTHSRLMKAAKESSSLL
ncbi:hypothetical protein PRIPAC_86195 [Pristionchus pacificus]|uniref:RNA-directed RNA polymerase n=1 Tax=Pristionchus pacificus TaxID=54126 RepID=A0A2A6BMR7_PRIPA|nr:hypothetical protein PRIPAC_86195 [Pristionchus pacificus]|eukprot:PDM67200.1 hypothetical protein PRIPAC_48617 [Pristionchus pacificus]